MSRIGASRVSPWRFGDWFSIAQWLIGPHVAKVDGSDRPVCTRWKRKKRLLPVPDTEVENINNTIPARIGIGIGESQRHRHSAGFWTLESSQGYTTWCESGFTLQDRSIDGAFSILSQISCWNKFYSADYSYKSGDAGNVQRTRG
jgi:hypothetical protein